MDMHKLLRDTNLSIALELGMQVISEEATSKTTWVIQTGPENYNLSHTPNWVQEIDSALKLPIPKDAQWNLIWHCHTGRDVASLNWYDEFDDSYGHTFEARRPWGELALAICLAWLSYRKWLNDQTI